MKDAVTRKGPPFTLLAAQAAADRLKTARGWLRAVPTSDPVLIIGHTTAAAARLAADGAAGRTVMGWSQTTVRRLAEGLARVPLAKAGLRPAPTAGPLMVQRAVQALSPGSVYRENGVCDTPGFPGAADRAVTHLLASGAGPADLPPGDLAELVELVADQWGLAGLANHLDVLRYAANAAADLAAMRVVLLDVRVRARAEEEFLNRVVSACAGALAVAPESDEVTLDALQRIGFRTASAPNTESSTGPAKVTAFSAPGEGAEAVEIARRILELARDGVRFDRIAVLTRSEGVYRDRLEEALVRAEIPACFANGLVRPNRCGRTFLSLLRFVEDDYSARQFKDYLALCGARHAQAWERLIDDAAVVRGRERWPRRLAKRRRELESKLEVACRDEPDSPRIARTEADITRVDALGEFVETLFGVLDQIPAGATWDEWLDWLALTAEVALPGPVGISAVNEVLAELRPLGPVGPVDLKRVCRVLGGGMLSRRTPPPARRGRVLVTDPDGVRGLEFDAVFLLGLSGGLFTPRGREGQLMGEDVRRLLNGRGFRVETQEQLDQEAGLAVAVAQGAARRRVFFSYPRLDPLKSEKRIPSPHALRAMEQASGRPARIKDFEPAGEAERLPHPGSAIDCAEFDLSVLRLVGQGVGGIVRAGYMTGANCFLANALRFQGSRWTLKKLTWADGFLAENPAGAAGTNGGAAAALAEAGPGMQPVSPTGLQKFAMCPYQFYLNQIVRLREVRPADGVMEMDPLQRGGMFHQVQFELLTELRNRGIDPAADVDRTIAVMEPLLERVAARYADDLCSLNKELWTAQVEAMGADLRAWIRRFPAEYNQYSPWLYELAFGLPRDEDRDERSVADPVDIGSGILLRGSIDLLERRPAPPDEPGASGERPAWRVRVTDYKTGKYPRLLPLPTGRTKTIIGKGEYLQPVLYALGAEGVLPDVSIEGGRLYYCTSAGGFRAVEVPLDKDAREAAALVGAAVGEAFETACFPALPRQDACRWCDYRTVCGPAEEARIQAKSKPHPELLTRLRRQP